MARPRFPWTNDLKDEILGRIAKGETLRQIVRGKHMPSDFEIYELRRADAAFALSYAQARDQQLEVWEDELIDIAENGRNDWMEREMRSGRMERTLDREHFERSRLRVDARKWIMAKRAPQRYGDAMRIESDMGPRAIIKPEPLSPAAWAEKFGATIIDARAVKAVPSAIGEAPRRQYGPDDAEVEIAPRDPGKRQIA
jgi:hypothetical protein